jgi:hypothetical protein
MGPTRDKIFGLGIILGLMATAPVFADSKNGFSSRKFLFYLSGDIGLAFPESDAVSGAAYTKKMRTPLVACAGFGVAPWSRLWLGMRYELWWAQREIETGGSQSLDTLRLQTLGPEVGWVRGNPRVTYLFVAGAQYPLQQKVEASSVNSYTSSSSNWNYFVRSSLELRFNSRLALHLEGGYRWVKIKGLQNGVTSFVEGNRDLNLSGPFVGMGLGLFF